MYIYEHPEWPSFTWNHEKLVNLLSLVSHQQGRLLGRMESLGFSLQSEANLAATTLEILKSNEIEGEILEHDEVRSSVARQLGLDIAGLISTDRNIDGIVEVMIDATRNFRKPLSAERLFHWHKSLFPSEKSKSHTMTIGQWRTNTEDNPMQVVSGPFGREQIHFRAPDSALIDNEMADFINWFNVDDDLNPILKAAIGHLWFVTIHPFDDGNGRLARTIADMLLTRADGIAQRFYSMSAQIRIERKAYYSNLEKTQRSTTDITSWLIWFLECLNRAINSAENELSRILFKSAFWEYARSRQLSIRQQKMINLLLDGFDGKLTSSKWAKICKCSQDTAGRDIQDLVSKTILVKEESGGRNTSYALISNFN
jgi:Fic family protein